MGTVGAAGDWVAFTNHPIYKDGWYCAICRGGWPAGAQACTVEAAPTLAAPKKTKCSCKSFSM
jgi:hypothetical protein